MYHLEINQDVHFEKIEHRILRAAWWLLLLVVVAAVLGLFGTGLLNRATAEQSGVTVVYPRFERMSRLTTLEVTVAPRAVQGEMMSVWFSREYLESFEITSVTPPPASGAGTNDGFIYTFRVTPGAPARAVFYLRVTEGTVGLLTGRIRAASAAEIGFRQFVWP